MQYITSFKFNGPRKFGRNFYQIAVCILTLKHLCVFNTTNLFSFIWQLKYMLLRQKTCRQAVFNP